MRTHYAPTSKAVLLKYVQPIRSQADYDRISRFVMTLLDRVEKGRTLSEDERNVMEVMDKLLRDYDAATMPSPSSLRPSDTIGLMMDNAGYTREDLAQLLGSVELADAVLENRAELTDAQRFALQQAWRIPASALQGSNLR